MQRHDEKPVYRPPLHLWIIGFVFWVLIVAALYAVWSL